MILSLYIYISLFLVLFSVLAACLTEPFGGLASPHSAVLPSAWSPPPPHPLAQVTGDAFINIRKAKMVPSYELCE